MVRRSRIDRPLQWGIIALPFSLDIDMDGGVIWVTMADETILHEATAKQAVEDAGFTLRHFEPASLEASQ